MGELVPLCEIGNEVELGAIRAYLDEAAITYLVRREDIPWYDGLGTIMAGRLAVVLVDSADVSRALAALEKMRPEEGSEAASEDG